MDCTFGFRSRYLSFLLIALLFFIHLGESKSFQQEQFEILYKLHHRHGEIEASQNMEDLSRGLPQEMEESSQQITNAVTLYSNRIRGHIMVALARLEAFAKDISPRDSEQLYHAFQEGITDLGMIADKLEYSPDQVTQKMYSVANEARRISTRAFDNIFNAVHEAVGQSKLDSYVGNALCEIGTSLIVSNRKRMKEFHDFFEEYKAAGNTNTTNALVANLGIMGRVDASVLVIAFIISLNGCYK